MPASRSLTLKVRPGFETTPKDSNGRRVYHWSRSQLKGASERKIESDAKRKAQPERAIQMNQRLPPFA